MRTVIYTESQSRDTRHVAGVWFHCARCLQVKPVHTDGGTGYASDRNTGRLTCYACCGQLDRLAMVNDGKCTLYLADGKVTNWPGTLAFKVLDQHKFRHPFARHAVIAYFRGPDGATWSAKNIGDSQIAHCRRLKAA